jgi:Tfp pilus assembly protein PilF
MDRTEPRRLRPLAPRTTRHRALPGRGAALGALSVVLTLAGSGCAGPNEEPLERRDALEPAPAPGGADRSKDTPIMRATRALESGDVASARRELEALLEDEPDDAQARYILARALSLQGELRAARVEVERSLRLDGQNPLAWSLLGSVCEQLGENARALQAYGEVHRLVPESLDPLHGMARTLLYLGKPDAALEAIAAARERPVKDPLTELLAFQALRRLGRSEDAEAVGRGFLLLLATRSADEQAEQADGARDVRRWLEQRGEPLDPDARRCLIEAVRAACRLRLPGTDDPADAVLGGGPPRLFAYDERPVFVTLFPPEGAELRGRGRGKSLAAALKGAIQALQERPGWSPLAVKDAAIQIEVGHTLEPVALRQGPRGIETDPPIVRGRHGIALRIDRQEAYCLPSEPLTQALPDLAAALSFATTSAGLGPDAWQGATTAYRFESDAWLSPGPGLTIVKVDQGEPEPLPQALPGELRDAVQAGARWLASQLRAGDAGGGGDLALGRVQDPTGRSLDGGVAAPAAADRAACAFYAYAV